MTKEDKIDNLIIKCCNDAWNWDGRIAKQLLKKYPKKIIIEARETPQLICNCFGCVKIYLEQKEKNSEMAERLKAAVLKTVKCNSFRSSNLLLAAKMPG